MPMESVEKEDETQSNGDTDESADESADVAEKMMREETEEKKKARVDRKEKTERKLISH